MEDCYDADDIEGDNDDADGNDNDDDGPLIGAVWQTGSRIMSDQSGV